MIILQFLQQICLLDVDMSYVYVSYVDMSYVYVFYSDADVMFSVVSTFSLSSLFYACTCSGQ